MNWQKIVAREWLILVGCAVVAFIFAVGIREEEAVVVAIPLYVFVLVARVTIWAIKTVRLKEG